MHKSSVSSGVIFLQHVDESKKEQARALRKSQTPAEEMLWQHLRGNRVVGVKFRRQQIIEGFIVDFFCHPAKLVVEVDGSIHDTPEQKEADAHRARVFNARGLMEIRFRNEEVLNDIGRVMAALTKLVKERL
jgi:very-short-patch-repair endonuclease